MIEIIIQFLNVHIVPIIDQIGFWFYVLVVLAAILESTLVIGTFVPGTAILLFFGFISSQGTVDLFGVILATSIGAVIGDFIGYGFGRYGRNYFVKEHTGLLRISHIETGKIFFNKHGGKSVVLGRFIGPIRQIIPFIAGAVQMPYWRFIYLNIIGAFLWAMVYIVFGYYFGSQWKLIDTVISRVGVVLSVIVICCVLYVYQYRKNTFLEKINSEIK